MNIDVKTRLLSTTIIILMGWRVRSEAACSETQPDKSLSLALLATTAPMRMEIAQCLLAIDREREEKREEAETGK